MLDVGIEAGGDAQVCMVCPPERLAPHDALYVIQWTRDHAGQLGAGMVRLCWEHMDALLRVIAEVV